MSEKWFGAAAWSRKEVHAGDRLPYLRLVDSNTVLLRDGSLMTALQVPGLLFETEETAALNAHAATREVMLRSNLDARFVLYHQVIRRRVAAWAFNASLSSVSNSSPGTCSTVITEPSRSSSVLASISRA